MSKILAFLLSLSLAAPSLGGADFDGLTNYIENTSFSWSTGGPVTVMYWINSAGAGTQALFSIGNQDIPHRFFAHSPWSDGNIYWDYGDYSGNGRISTSFASYIGVDTHVALVSEGNSGGFRGIYINGDLITSIASSDGPDTALTGVTLGVGTSGVNTWYQNADIDDFRIYNRRLTATEIENIAKSNQYFPITDGLQLWWRADEGANAAVISTSAVLDRSGNGWTGSGVNSPLFRSKAPPLSYP